MANKYTKTPCPKGLARLYKIGLTQVEIAKHYKVTQKIVWRWMRDLKIKTRVARKRNQYGENNDSWKGNNAGYAALHYRVYKERGLPKKCEVCGEKDPNKRYEWANLTGKLADTNDYKRMCVKCHRNYDRKKT